MAVLPIQFPEDWPDFVVTSHKRPSGSHASGLAIDIAPVWPSEDYSRTSKFWFYYFHTFFVLWASQNHGTTLFSVPPTCPHFHIHDVQGVNKVGAEWINKINGKCVPYHTRTINKLDMMDSIRFRNFVENDIGTGGHKGWYLGAWANLWEDLKGKFDFSKRWVQVSSNIETLPDAKLQALLNNMYGGTKSDRFLNDMSQIVGANSWDSLKGAVVGNVVLYGVLGGIAYYLYNEQKNGRLMSARKIAN